MARLARTALLLALAFGTACSSAITVGVDAGPQIARNGISVPVPPPSLLAAPIQKVDVEGDIDINNYEPGTEVYLLEVTSELGYFVLAESDGTFRFEGVELDLTDNCIELWWEAPGANGDESMHSFFEAKITADDQSIDTEQRFGGCPRRD